MKQFIVTILIFVSFLSFGQDFQKPDYQSIEKNIKKQNTSFYYPKLMERYLHCDTTLSLDEKRHLYYGYAFEPKYAPYDNSKYADSIAKLMSRKDKLGATEWQRIVEYGDKVLAKDPFSLRALNYQMYALERLNDGEKSYKKAIQMSIIIEAVLSSGHGMTPKDALFVINVEHELDIIGILGLHPKGKQRFIEYNDYRAVAKNKYGIEGLYFDITPCLKSAENSFK
ncbi:MAG: DUF4919 domain-containing protein [Bacteroidales bacterium]|jgi:hypothetical protein|nr:DUF4919 domain-containing protein [Bacteroidales bacterium]